MRAIEPRQYYNSRPDGHDLWLVRRTDDTVGLAQAKQLHTYLPYQKLKHHGDQRVSSGGGAYAHAPTPSLSRALTRTHACPSKTLKHPKHRSITDHF